MLVDKKLSEFLNELASGASTPGGGSSAALVAANAAALVSMVCNLTIDKKGYEEVQDAIREILHDSEKLREELTRLIDLDAEAFDEIMDAYRLPKSNFEEKAIRKEAIQAATRKASQVPMRTIELAVETLSLAKEVAEVGNKNVLSDAGVAASLASAAVESAWFNVEINLKGIDDDKFVEEMEEHGENLMDEADELYEAALDAVDRMM
ncbi:MAG TPA: methenyltetrahydrofolate cyclohydrolase [candidate division Zixibacteria bacterium]|nr:methenyltetrahydrofolate cyclohydrolase [candidate division Zixibacteria bacterium]